MEEFAKHVDASVSTVRRTVTFLGRHRRNSPHPRRRARRQSRIPMNLPFHARDTHQLAEKEAIGKACAELIKPNQRSSSTPARPTYHVARHLEPKTPQIITNSLPVANLFAAANRVEVVVSGGVIYPRLGVLVGPLAVEAFSKIHADVAIMSAGGITLEGITNSHGLLIDIQRAMIRAAQRVIFCFDRTKFGRQSVSFLCDLDCIDTIVTDAGAPTDLVCTLQQKGVQVVVGR